MSQQDKGRYYRALKTAGVPFSKHYREYTLDELTAAYAQLEAAGQAPPLDPPQPQGGGPAPTVDPEAAAFFGFNAPAPVAPVAAKNPNEMAGARLNTKDELEPIRTDPETGNIWFQEEVLKPAFPKPRGRRVLRYKETGVREETVGNGKYTETFEVAGDEIAREAEVKITLPSYQVGIYLRPQFPFKIVCYNGNEGFDLFEVQKFFGGAELVPEEVKRKYVENVLCYDIRTVVRAIETEYRAGVLAGKIS
jgi:hypothetical protein